MAPQWLHHSPHLTILVSEAILSAENSGKPLLDRGLRPEHCWGSSQRSPRPSSWWEGRVLLLSPREPLPPAVDRPSVLRSWPPNEKFYTRHWFCPALRFAICHNVMSSIRDGFQIELRAFKSNIPVVKSDRHD